LDIRELQKTANEMRKDIIDMIYTAQSGHPGGSLSAADIFAVLYFKEMNVDPKNPDWEDRDRLVLSKGHASPVLYAALAEKGFFPKDKLKTFRKINTKLQGHPNMNDTPGVDMTTGSLGQGLSAACGMALAGRLDKKGYRAYAVLGDGECEEGQIWEAAMSAAQYKLDNLTAILDHNGLQIDGRNDEVMNIEPIEDKWKAFGWYTIRIDGHDMQQIIDALDRAKETKERPTLIIANTVKGKGVSYMENQVGWHGTAPDKEQRDKAIEELTQRGEGIE
jgi:transketolase